VVAATNRADILDPALMRSGRLDRKIEFPHPNEDARAKILRIHSRKMNVAPDANFEELARRWVGSWVWMRGARLHCLVQLLNIVVHVDGNSLLLRKQQMKLHVASDR
jgi:ATP-dependent 26S proteasome regulatory subunit